MESRSGVTGSNPGSAKTSVTSGTTHTKKEKHLLCGDKGIVEFLRTHGPTSENDLALINSENKNVPYIPHSNDVEKLDIRNGNKDSVTSVYFAKGDERQAVRKFINENYEFVRECMEGRNPSLRRRFNGIIGQVFAEEWRKRNRIQYG